MIDLIGDVVSPSITIGTAPHGFTKDVCVVKLDKPGFCLILRGTLSTWVRADLFR